MEPEATPVFDLHPDVKRKGGNRRMVIVGSNTDRRHHLVTLAEAVVRRPAMCVERLESHPGAGFSVGKDMDMHVSPDTMASAMFTCLFPPDEAWCIQGQLYRTSDGEAKLPVLTITILNRATDIFICDEITDEDTPYKRAMHAFAAVARRRGINVVVDNGRKDNWLREEMK